jgi:hypothetical protein
MCMLLFWEHLYMMAWEYNIICFPTFVFVDGNSQH